MKLPEVEQWQIDEMNRAGAYNDYTQKLWEEFHFKKKKDAEMLSITVGEVKAYQEKLAALEVEVTVKERKIGELRSKLHDEHKEDTKREATILQKVRDMFDKYFLIAEWGYFALLALMLMNSAILIGLLWRR